MPRDCPKPLAREALVWNISPPSLKADLERWMPDDPGLAQFKVDLGDFLCTYYNTTQGLKKACGVSPVACGIDGGKGFKVRWVLPGHGKRGGLRLAVLAVCGRLIVTVCFAAKRKTEPTDAELAKAFKAQGDAGPRER